jgi:imidazolonepropionase-like amidohydrolase
MNEFCKYCLIGLAVGLSKVTVAQRVYTHIALLNATAHIGNGQVIDGSLVVINKDRIETVAPAMGLKLDYRAFDTVINLSGKHIYPALINCNNVLGLHDAEAVRATVDYAEVGQVNPHVRSLAAYNTDNLIIPTVKPNGVLYTQATPRGGLISGSSSIMALEGWNWEDAVVKADDGIHLNFPRLVLRRNDNQDEVMFRNAVKKYTDEINSLEKFFSDAKAYCQVPVAETNLRFEAMRPVFAGSARLYVHADKVKDLLLAIGFMRRFEIKKPVIVGGKESYKVTSELRRYQIPVMLGRINDLPDYIGDDVDIVNRLPGLLQKDSVLYCIQVEGDMEAMQSRNLPFNAGAAVAYGISKEEALSAITLNAAKIIGIDKILGTLEPGKLASVVVSDGDILDMRTNRVILAYLSGKPVNLNNRQTELYLKYKNKYGIR